MIREDGDTSEVTVYTRAVPMSSQLIGIDKMLDEARSLAATNVRKLSSSSEEEAMDTSDEADVHLVSDGVVAGNSNDPQFRMFPEPEKKIPSAGKTVEDIVRNAEISKARMYEVPGTVNIQLIDQDYQMIDVHVDETLRKRIQNLEFVDLGKLLQKSKVIREEG